MKITFEKLTHKTLSTVFKWLEKDYIQEFWDNTQGHKDDILNFVSGRKTPSNYCDGKYVYWIASCDGSPFAMLMTIQETHKEDIAPEKIDRLSKTGHTYGLDYMIGDPNFFGKGYGAKTLSEFLDFFRRDFDVSADTFLIDPACNNPRAKHVYMKAGFEHVCDFLMEGECSGAGQMHHLLIKKSEPTISVIGANLADYPMIQNMARFYVYDLSKECGHISADWALPVDGLYESFDFKNYFEDPSRKAYLVKVYDEIAGFVLLWEASTHWNMGEFFIIAKFQGQGIGERVARHIWDQHPGIWEVSVIPENKKALSFWRKTIPHFQENTKIVDYDPDQPKRIIFTFDTKNKDAEKQVTIRPSKSDDISALVSLSHMKRLNYEKAHPQFWKYAGADAEISQTKWFEELLLRDDHIMLTAQNGSAIIGFIIGKMMSSPEVYNPGGLTLMIDDFCIAQEDLWGSVGKQLISEINLIAKTKGAVQTVIVTGNHDNPKRDFLKSMGLTIASQWYVGGII